MNRVLIVEDKKNLRVALKTFLTEAGFAVSEAQDLHEARISLNKKFPEIAVIDVRLPDGSGLDLLDEMAEAGKSVIAVMMSAYSEVPVAVSAMKKGAKDFVIKPFEPSDLIGIIKRELSLFQTRPAEEEYFEPMGTSKPWAEIMNMARKVAENDSTVLLSGETGSGKEVVARYIHFMSKRSRFPFVPVNCAALPKELVESELFGAESGAFTGIDKARVGKFESAQGGTLFLDEIGDLSEEAQAKILRILETKKIQRLGSVDPRLIDVRIISATNKNLRQEIEKGFFREDLFYRLSVFPIEIPPLRDHPEDIPVIAEHLIGRISGRIGKKFDLGLNFEGKEKLTSHDWPGNVRELSNVIERAMILSQGQEIEASKIYIPEKRSGTPIRRAKESGEMDAIKKALTASGWNRKDAAKMLGVSYRNLLEKIKKYGLKED